MKASQTQATSPKVSSPCQRCPEGKWRSRTSATLRRCSVASRTGMSSTRSIRCTWGQSLFIPSLLFPYSFWKTPSGVSRTGGLHELYLGNTQVTDRGLKELKELESLQTLNLCETKITDTGLKELKGLRGLQVLALGD